MPIRVNLDRVLLQRRMSLTELADRVGVTRSVIVYALRKLESAGLIESRSLGM